MDNKSSQSGFALLITLIVVGVVLSIGFSILDISIKQVKLSTNAKESELAFHAANAGMECAQYWRRDSEVEMETGQPITPTCFGELPDTVNSVANLTQGVSGDGEVFKYQYDFTWGAAGEPRCTRVTTLVASSSVTGVGVTITNASMNTEVPGYPDAGDKFCEPGSRCSVISVQGYNRTCTNTGGYGVVQREVLLQF